MGSRSRSADTGADRARRLIARLGQELRDARRDRNLSLSTIARAAGTSPSAVSRIERGRTVNGSLLTLARLGHAVGLDLSVRFYPGADPVRDAAHLKLIRDFRARLHPALRAMTEVPVGLPGDQRAFDLQLIGTGWTCGVEAETGPRDSQATNRRAMLKLRDSGVDRMLLLLSDTRQSRLFLEAAGDSLAADFPVPGRLALARLERGEDPGGNSIIVLPRRDRRARQEGRE